LTEHFPQAGRVDLHDVTHDTGLTGPPVPRRLPRAHFRGAEYRHREASPRNSNGLTTLLDLVQESKALGFELSGVHYSRCHDLHDNREKDGHLTMQPEGRTTEVGASASSKWGSCRRAS